MLVYVGCVLIKNKKTCLVFQLPSPQDTRMILAPLIWKLVLSVFIVFVSVSNSVNLSETLRSHVEKLIEAWVENPQLIPNRLSGTVTVTTERITQVPDILIWDPVTQHKITLTCPHCLHSSNGNSLYATRWKDGKASYDEPRKLFCIQREVLLVSRVYRCKSGHQILAHDPWILKTISSSTHVPFVLFHKSGVTRDLFHYVFTHVQAGVKLTDIKNFLERMYNDAAMSTLSSTNAPNFVSSLESPGRRIVTNCFIRSYFEYEHMFAQHTADIPYTCLSADHTFKVSANIGFWHKGSWVNQYDSLFCVLNEQGHVVAWQLTKGTSFDKVRALLTNLKSRVNNTTNGATRFYIDNCCMWSRNLKEVFGENIEVKLDLFHATQRITKKIPKRGKKDNPIKAIRRRMLTI